MFFHVCYILCPISSGTPVLPVLMKAVCVRWQTSTKAEVRGFSVLGAVCPWRCRALEALCRPVEHGCSAWLAARAGWCCGVEDAGWQNSWVGWLGPVWKAELVSCTRTIHPVPSPCGPPTWCILACIWKQLLQFDLFIFLGALFLQQLVVCGLQLTVQNGVGQYRLASKICNQFVLCRGNSLKTNFNFKFLNALLQKLCMIMAMETSVVFWKKFNP